MTTEQRRDAVADTFMQMICETSLESIRVQDIAQRAGISKATFYRLFRDKYDVMSWIYMSVLDPHVSISPELTNWKAWTYIHFEHIRQHLSFYKRALVYDGQNSMAESMMQYFQRNMIRGISCVDGKRRLSAQVQFAVEAFSHVNVYTVVRWVRNDCSPALDTLISYVEGCIPDCLKPYFNP